MDSNGLAHMTHTAFNSAMPSGLASRRGGQSIKPLSFDGLKSQTDIENGVPTPRTSRSHLLAGLRTAPKSATTASFSNGPNSPTIANPQGRNRNSMYDNTNVYSGPKTSLPRYGSVNQQGYNPNMTYGQPQYTTEQILAPPQIQLDEHVQEQIDPNLHAQLMYTNAYLSDQQQRLQQQLRALQAAAQQFQGLNLNSQVQMMQQAYPNMYQQQAQQQQMQQQVQQQVQQLQAMMTPVTPQHNVYSVYDPVTGQQALYMDQGQAQQAQLAQLNTQMANQQVQMANRYSNMQQQSVGTPRVQVSPPPVEHNRASFRNPSPPRRNESPVEATPLPPPSANAFRRGHKKSSSTANGNKGQLSIATDESSKTTGPKTASFPLTPMTAGYGPGQGRAGEHPVRQPRNPPSMDELKAKPTAKHDGSKNFVARTRRTAINVVLRSSLERRKEAQSTGSISPISESAEETVDTPLTDNDSESGRSGSGSLVDNDDAECSLPSSRTSTGSWGAIGSDRPSSRQKVNRDSIDSTNSSDNESSNEPGSFASLLKKSNRAAKTESVDGQRKAPMLVLTSAEKRKLAA
ncbi:hypothetical protein B0T19DRAFT_356206 [Cercophora scortea]|uniref:Uncharacterized protein n=1 Tax=Cercophora scortea TaxID=314031 RepID=A0AAE0IL96_9PEZI|nr:hypothetical protein B0T19DRAFT_356206 [Cercophora scortea]